MQGVLVQRQGKTQDSCECDGDKASGEEDQRGPDGVEDDFLEEVGCAPVALHEGFGEAVAEVRAGDNDDAEHGDDVEDGSVEQDGAKEGGGVDEGEVEFAGELGGVLAGDEEPVEARESMKAVKPSAPPMMRSSATKQPKNSPRRRFGLKMR